MKKLNGDIKMFTQIWIHLNKVPGAEVEENEPLKMNSNLFNCRSSTEMINFWESQEHATVATTEPF